MKAFVIVAVLVALGLLAYAVLRPAGRYQVASTSDIGTIRVDTRTGEMWVLVTGTSGQGWRPMARAE